MNFCYYGCGIEANFLDIVDVSYNLKKQDKYSISLTELERLICDDNYEKN